MNTNTARWVLPSKDEGLTSGNPVDLNNLDTVEAIDDEGCIAFTLKSTGLSVKWLFTSKSALDRVYINVLERLECSEGMLDGSDLGDRNRETNSRIDARFKQLENDGKMGKPAETCNGKTIVYKTPVPNDTEGQHRWLKVLLSKIRDIWHTPSCDKVEVTIGSKQYRIICTQDRVFTIHDTTSPHNSSLVLGPESNINKVFRYVDREVYGRPHD